MEGIQLKEINANTVVGYIVEATSLTFWETYSNYIWAQVLEAYIKTNHPVYFTFPEWESVIKAFAVKLYNKKMQQIERWVGDGTYPDVDLTDRGF